MPKRWIERLLFAETCTLCGEPLGASSVVCDRCLLSIHPQPEEDLLSIPYLDGYRTFTAYGEIERKILELVKFQGFKHLAREIGKLVSPHLREYEKLLKPDAVTFIPTNPFRYWFLRGFDPVEEILKGTSVNFERIIGRRWLFRKPLARIKSIRERQRLVKDAFYIKREKIPRLRGGKILVVDDVLTTGSTASEIARLLKSAGAVEVYLFAVFRPH